MAYIPHPQHRNAAFASQKSQWSISVLEETQTFTSALAAEWTANDAVWGLYLVQAVPVILGTTALPNQFEVQIAKFVGNQGDWHGYPVAHWLAPYDRPAYAVLEKWRNGGIINKAKFAKIYRGKRCSL
ncbi:hypothetical protein RA210_U360005 [Rubrivivax sp. A210]|nr:hypothetical protein RA210_U360005 [Rubrivivax sp. A210]